MPSNTWAVERRKHAVLSCLRARTDRPVRAIELGEALHLGGNREHKRREVRRLVGLLHGDGFRVCADNHPTEGGYWLAEDDAEWGLYTESRRIGARHAFATTRRMATAARERRDGQANLFDRPVEGTREHAASLHGSAWAMA